MRKFLLLIGVMLLSGTQSQAQNLINNFSFETPTVASSFTTLTPSSSATGFNTSTTWNITAGSVDVVLVGGGAGALWAAPAAHGTQTLDLNGSASGTIRQTVTTSTFDPGVQFQLSFAYSRNLDMPAGTTATGTYTVATVGGTTLASGTMTRIVNTDGATKSGPTPTFNWTNVTVPLFAAGGSDIVVTFTDTTAVVGQGIELDNIVLTPVPEPSSIMALSAFGLGAIGFTFRKRKN